MQPMEAATTPRTKQSSEEADHTQHLDSGTKLQDNKTDNDSNAATAAHNDDVDSDTYAALTRRASSHTGNAAPLGGESARNVAQTNPPPKHQDVGKSFATRYSPQEADAIKQRGLALFQQWRQQQRPSTHGQAAQTRRDGKQSDDVSATPIHPAITMDETPSSRVATPIASSPIVLDADKAKALPLSLNTSATPRATDKTAIDDAVHSNSMSNDAHGSPKCQANMSSSIDMVPLSEMQHMREELIEQFNLHMSRCESSNQEYYRTIAAKYNNDMGSIAQERDNWKSMYDNLQNEYHDKVSESNAQLTAEKDELQKQLDIAKQRLLALESENSVLIAENEQLDNTLQLSEEELNRLRATYEQERDALHGERVEVSRTLDEVRKQLAHTQHELYMTRENAENAENERRILHEQLQQTLDKRDAQIEKLEKELREVQCLSRAHDGRAKEQNDVKPGEPHSEGSGYNVTVNSNIDNPFVDEDDAFGGSSETSIHATTSPIERHNRLENAHADYAAAADSALFTPCADRTNPAAHASATGEAGMNDAQRIAQLEAELSAAQHALHDLTVTHEVLESDAEMTAQLLDKERASMMELQSRIGALEQRMRDLVSEQETELYALADEAAERLTDTETYYLEKLRLLEDEVTQLRLGVLEAGPTRSRSADEVLNRNDGQAEAGSGPAEDATQLESDRSPTAPMWSSPQAPTTTFDATTVGSPSQTRCAQATNTNKQVVVPPFADLSALAARHHTFDQKSSYTIANTESIVDALRAEVAHLQTTLVERDREHAAELESLMTECHAHMDEHNAMLQARLREREAYYQSQLQQRRRDDTPAEYDDGACEYSNAYRVEDNLVTTTNPARKNGRDRDTVNRPGDARGMTSSVQDASAQTELPDMTEQTQTPASHNDLSLALTQAQHDCVLAWEAVQAQEQKHQRAMEELQQRNEEMESLLQYGADTVATELTVLQTRLRERESALAESVSAQRQLSAQLQQRAAECAALQARLSEYTSKNNTNIDSRDAYNRYNNGNSDNKFRKNSRTSSSSSSSSIYTKDSHASSSRPSEAPTDMIELLRRYVALQQQRDRHRRERDRARHRSERLSASVAQLRCTLALQRQSEQRYCEELKHTRAQLAGLSADVQQRAQMAVGARAQLHAAQARIDDQAHRLALAEETQQTLQHRLLCAEWMVRLLWQKLDTLPSLMQQQSELWMTSYTALSQVVSSERTRLRRWCESLQRTSAAALQAAERQDAETAELLWQTRWSALDVHEERGRAALMSEAAVSCMVVVRELWHWVRWTVLPQTQERAAAAESACAAAMQMCHRVDQAQHTRRQRKGYHYSRHRYEQLQHRPRRPPLLLQQPPHDYADAVNTNRTTRRAKKNDYDDDGNDIDMIRQSRGSSHENFYLPDDDANHDSSMENDSMNGSSSGSSRRSSSSDLDEEGQYSRKRCVAADVTRLLAVCAAVLRVARMAVAESGVSVRQMWPADVSPSTDVLLLSAPPPPPRSGNAHGHDDDEHRNNSRFICSNDCGKDAERCTYEDTDKEIVCMESTHDLSTPISTFVRGAAHQVGRNSAESHSLSSMRHHKAKADANAVAATSEAQPQPQPQPQHMVPSSISRAEQDGVFVCAVMNALLSQLGIFTVAAQSLVVEDDALEELRAALTLMQSGVAELLEAVRRGSSTNGSDSMNHAIDAERRHGGGRWSVVQRETMELIRQSSHTFVHRVEHHVHTMQHVLRLVVLSALDAKNNDRENTHIGMDENVCDVDEATAGQGNVQQPWHAHHTLHDEQAKNLSHRCPKLQQQQQQQLSPSVYRLQLLSTVGVLHHRIMMLMRGVQRLRHLVSQPVWSSDSSSLCTAAAAAASATSAVWDVGRGLDESDATTTALRSVWRLFVEAEQWVLLPYEALLRETGVMDNERA